MKCPVCPDASLLMMERQGVEIDYCPQCRGVWLDRGELDKLIERAVAPEMPTSQATSPRYAHQNSEHTSHHSGYGQEHRRKKSWISEIFD